MNSDELAEVEQASPTMSRQASLDMIMRGDMVHFGVEEGHHRSNNNCQEGKSHHKMEKKNDA
eukprot:5590114-Heterocapsa_arctica.AAC.1